MNEYEELLWNVIYRETRRTRRITCHSATFAMTNPTWTEPGTNQGLRRDRPATNLLNHGTAFDNY